MRTATTTLRVRYAETDQMGVVYYAHYFVWFEVARAELLRQQGWSYREMEASGVILPVIEAYCEYRRPARYDDQVEVHAEGRLASAVRMPGSQSQVPSIRCWSTIAWPSPSVTS